MKPVDPTVFLYVEGQFQDEIRFRSKWMAYVFHLILNRSTNGKGMRGY